MRENNVTKLSVIILIILFAWMFSFSSDSAWGSCRIENISLKKEGNFTKVCVYADQPFECIHSTEEAKGGKPYRVIIDCKDAIFGLPQHNYKKGLPPGIIKAIRTSQFQTVPERMVRVVLDLKGPVVYKVTDPESENEASIAILTTQYPDFPLWVAVLEEKEDQKISVGKKLTKVSSTEIASQEEQKSDQLKASLAGAKRTTDLTVSEKEEAEPAQKGRIYRRAVCYADTGEVVLSAEKKPVLLSQAQSGDEGVKKKEPKKIEAKLAEQGKIPKRMVSYTDTVETLPSVERKPVLLSRPKTEDKDIKKGKEFSPIMEKKALPPELEVTSQASLEQSKEQTKSSSHQADAERVEEDKSQKDISSVSAKLVLKPKSRTKVEDKKAPSVFWSSSKQSLLKPSIPKRQISRSKVPLGPFLEDKSSEATEKTKITDAETEGKEDVSTGAPGSVQKGIGRILGPESVAARESHALAESLILIQSPQESKQDWVHERKMVYYNPGTRRDPFLPLTERQDMSFGEVPLPLFENLKLVGILKDEKGNWALLEDKLKFGYILMSGDRIKNGYVISVEDDRAIFHVEEYGGYQIMILELNREY